MGLKGPAFFVGIFGLMGGLEELKNLIEPLLVEQGLNLVQVKDYQLHGRCVVQIMMERLKGDAVTFHDCSKISNVVLDLLENNDPIGGDYNIEVTSAGLDRPLVKLQDYDTFKESRARIVVKKKIRDLRQLVGTLKGVDGGSVLFEEGTTGDVLSLKMENIKSANLETEVNLKEYFETVNF